MKKIAGAVILLLITITIFVVFTKFSVPTMKLQYTVEGKTEKVSVKHGTSSWNNIFGSRQSDSLHPLDSVGRMQEIEKTDDIKELHIEFSSPPTSYTARRWKESYIRNEDAYENYYERLDVSDNTIYLPDDGRGYIYEVHAIWPQGNVYYAFYVTNDR